VLQPLVSGEQIFDSILFLDQRLGLIGAIPEAGLGRFL